MSEGHLSIRANADLLSSLRCCAKRAGSSVSDYVRSILRDHVALVSDTSPPPINVEVTPTKSVHELAARGDAAGFAELAGWHYQRGLDGAEPQVIAYARATDYSRLAMIARGERQDWLNHLFLLEAYGSALRNAGLGNLSDAAIAESVALAATMAEEGDEEMASLIAIGAGNVSPGAMTLARDLQRQAKETTGC